MADDEGNAGGLAHAHNDFDLQDVFKDFSLDPPSMEEVLKEAKKFGNAHRRLINNFILEPTMSAKKMNLLFAKYVTTVKFKKHPEAVMKIQATPDTSKELTKIIMKTINTDCGVQRKEFRPWRLAILTDEKSPVEYVTITGCTQNSTIISDNSSLTKAERALLLTVLEEMMKGDGTVKMRFVHNLVKEDPYKMTGPKCDQFLSTMAKQRYLKMDSEEAVVEITPRILVELEAWLRAKFPGKLKICEGCQKIVGRPVYTAECHKCHAVQHLNCFKKALSISGKDSMECYKCKEELGMTEVQEQVEERRHGGMRRNSSRAANSGNESGGEPNDDDTMDDD